MDYEEFNFISKEISKTSNKMRTHYKGGTVQHSLLSDLFNFLEDNGGCVFLNKKVKHLKTQDNYIETYIAKYGIKFQVISCCSRNPMKCIDLRIKVL